MVLDPLPNFIGFFYAVTMIFIVAYLWYSCHWRLKIGWLVLILSSILGFLLFSPVVPYQFQQIVLRTAQGLGAPLIAGIVGLAILFVLTWIFGRFFCGYLCPVGAVQEIAYSAPAPKFRPPRKILFLIIRSLVFLAIILAAVAFSFSLLEVFGIKDFFYLTLTAGSAVFVLVLLISLFFYRPFCRLVCPVGFLFSLGAVKSLFRLHRTNNCINCKKCEKVCPSEEGKKEDRKAECYLCGRCRDICPKGGALIYSMNQELSGPKED